MIADKHLVRSVCCGEGGEIIDDSMRVVRFPFRLQISKSKIEARHRTERSKMRMLRDAAAFDNRSAYNTYK